jgi:hypothetical protein
MLFNMHISGGHKSGLSYAHNGLTSIFDNLYTITVAEQLVYHVEQAISVVYGNSHLGPSILFWITITCSLRVGNIQIVVRY